MSGAPDEDVWVESFNWGYTHFDHLGGAYLVLFQSCTLEGWVDIMYLLQDAHNDMFASFYFVILVFVGSFFLLNVTLAIVWDAFESCEQKEEEFALDTDGDGIPDLDPSEIRSDPDSEEEFLGADMGMASTSSARSFAKQQEPDWLPCPLVRIAKIVVFSEIFQYVIMFVIVMNVITLSLDSYPADLSIEPGLSIMNKVFTIVFVVEMVAIHFAIGPKRYWSERAYAFDGIIVITSLLEFSPLGGGSAVLALRGFRLLRVFKLAKKWQKFRLLLKAMVQTVLEMGNFVLLLSLMMVVFALMGQVFFAGKFLFHPDTGRPVPDHMLDEVCTSPLPSGTDYKYDACVPRAHFDTFPWAFVTIFQILSGENWNVVMYDGMRASGWHSAFFFIICVLIGNFLVLNLFLAILMSNFEEESRRQRELELAKNPKWQQKNLADKVAKHKQLSSFLKTSPYGKALASVKDKSEEDQSPQPGQIRHSGTSASVASSDQVSSSTKSSPTKPKSQTAPGSPSDDMQLPGTMPTSFEGGSQSSATSKPSKLPEASHAYVSVQSMQTDETDLDEMPQVQAKLSAASTIALSIREACKKSMRHPGFDNSILVCIFLSSFAMALDNPLDDPASIKQQSLY
jgi:hypothetical protein